MSRVLKIASRKSALAKLQTYLVLDALKKNFRISKSNFIFEKLREIWICRLLSGKWEREVFLHKISQRISWKKKWIS
ncbi:hypothetical protein LEP1GSC133_3326 [Leptospira borgpetersenii serovar Pomona str. 200901868]|uniref:Uncharacterized protein n=1 Tax=Leptospira borgpetersenii serovar Pomona str. 200901868 TaxID=1192866 RepID=M6VV60_LEPBO|nr:hypothetical protein LEP1GSC133_3326 [Leptospira borgpetersenii serovar Pomona str. 200901868]